MEYSLSSVDAVVRPWRRATVLLAAVAGVELILLLVAGLVLIARPLAHRGQAVVPRRVAPAVHKRTRHHRLPAVHRARVHVPRLSRAQTYVLVLNGNGRQHAAATEAAIVHARGYPIAAVGNTARNDYPRSLVMYRPGYRPEAVRLAHDLNVQIVGPLDGRRPADLKGAKLVVVVGNA